MRSTTPERAAWVTSPVRPLATLVSGQGIAALAGLAFGKLTATYIPPVEWGYYNLLLTGMLLLHSLLVAPTLQSFKTALARFSRRQVLAFYGRVLLLMYTTLMPLIALLIGLYYQNWVFGWIWIAAVGQGVYQFGNDDLNALGRHRTYALMQAGYALINLLLFGVIMVGFGQKTTTGLWQSLALLNGLFAGLSFWRLYRADSLFGLISGQPKLPTAELTRAYWRFVRPLLSLAIWTWLINYADRYLIQYYLTDADVGQYAMGYSLGSKLLILAGPLLAFLVPQVLQLRADGQDSAMANPLLLRNVGLYGTIAGVGCVLFYAGHVEIGRWLLSERYKPAFIIGPIVAVGYLFLTSIHLLEIKWYAYGQTGFILVHNVVGAVLHITLNLLLIPRMGIAGAALATLLGYAGQFLLVLGLFLLAKSNDETTAD